MITWALKQATLPVFSNVLCNRARSATHDLPTSTTSEQRTNPLKNDRETLKRAVPVLFARLVV